MIASWIAFGLGLACVAGLIAHAVAVINRSNRAKDAAIDVAEDNAMNAQADRLSLKP